MNPMRRINRIHISSPLLAGLLSTFIWMFAGTLIVSLLLLISNMQEWKLSTYSFVIHGIAVFLGGITSGKKAGKKGWYHGGILGALYAIVVSIIGFLAFDAGITSQTTTLLIVCFLFGALGGMIGINLRK